MRAKTAKSIAARLFLARLAVGASFCIAAAAPWPSHGQAKLPECNCVEHLKALQVELHNARVLAKRFTAFGAEIDRRMKLKLYDNNYIAREKSPKVLKELAETAAQDLKNAGPKGAPDHIDYVPLGSAYREDLVKFNDPLADGWKVVEDFPSTKTVLINDKLYPVADAKQREAAWKQYEAKKINLCRPMNPAKFYGDLQRASACEGIHRALLAHEKVHVDTCREKQFFAYWFDMTGVDRAAEEVRA